ncbi:MAG: alanyl-tRNA editing protein [Candidatus Thorarchaeota archaeon]|nr:alanyl-tRNA editing protein [Candidatus Thorarchaeota archaeon]
MVTELLHMHDNYLQEFDAKIIELGDGYVILDRTAFYPEGGGQSGDRGVLSDGTSEVHVIDTKKREGKIFHLLDANPPFEVGATVHGKLDWDFRYECMRFHTAQHVLSRYLQINHGLETYGNMIKPGRSRADYHPIDHFTEELKREVEAGVNEIFAKNLDVTIQFMPRDEAIAFLREKGYQVRYLEMVPATVSEFRVVMVDDYDAAACAGTHVANTREIGKIRLGKTKNVGSKKQRLYFSLEPPK